MDRWPITVAISLLLGAFAFSGVYFWQKGKFDRHHAHLSAFEWFCEEFEVTGDRRERIRALHAAYFPECEDHCVHYVDTRETLAKIIADPELNRSPDHVAAAHRLSEIEREADKRFIDFIYAVSREMDQPAANSYLTRMKGWLDRERYPVSK